MYNNDHSHNYSHYCCIEEVIVVEMSRMISKSKLKAKMLEIFRNIEATGEELIVTDHGTPVLRIVTFEKRKSLIDLFGDLQGSVIYHEDIDTPTVDEWPDT